jgi:hypothetical protein
LCSDIIKAVNICALEAPDEGAFFMEDNETYLTIEEAWEAGFGPKVDKLLEDKIANKSGRLRALHLLDEMDTAAEEMGISIDKVKVATFMKENEIFDPKEAVGKLYSPEQRQDFQPNSDSQQKVPTGITKENLFEKVHEVVSGGEEENLEFSFDSLAAKLSSK